MFYRNQCGHNIRCVCVLEIFVETVPLGDELLLPLSESGFLLLDLFGESLPEVLFLLLELGVVELPRAGLSELASFHLLGTVYLVVRLFGRVDEVKHVGADQDATELLEVTVIVILYLSDTPCILTTLDDTAVCGLHIFLTPDNCEWHSSLSWISSAVNESTHPLLEENQICGRKGVGFSNDRDKVDTGRESLHDFDVEGLQCVTGWSDEVQAGVDTEVNLLGTARLLLLKHVGLVLVIDELDNGHP